MLSCDSAVDQWDANLWKIDDKCKCFTPLLCIQASKGSRLGKTSHICKLSSDVNCAKYKNGFMVSPLCRRKRYSKSEADGCVGHLDLQSDHISELERAGELRLSIQR